MQISLLGAVNGLAPHHRNEVAAQSLDPADSVMGVQIGGPRQGGPRLARSDLWRSCRRSYRRGPHRGLRDLRWLMKTRDLVGDQSDRQPLKDKARALRKQGTGRKPQR